MSVTSNELNYLIWRYLQEAGLAGTCDAFEHETEVDSLDQQLGPVTPVGQLVNVLQKGVHYMQLEALLTDEDTTKHRSNVLGDLSMLAEAAESRNEQTKKSKTFHTRTMSVAPDSLFQARSKEKNIVNLDVAAATDCVWSPDGTLLAVASIGIVYIYKFIDNVPNAISITVEANEISCIILSNTVLAIGTFSGDVLVYPIADVNKKYTLEGVHLSPVLSIDFVIAHNRNMIIAIDCLRTVGVWDCDTGARISSLQADNLSTVTDTISDVKVLTDKRLLATTTGKNGSINLYSLSPLAKFKRLKGHTEVVNVLCYRPASELSRELFVSGSQDHSVRVWDLETMSTKFILEGHQTGVIALKLCRNVEQRDILVSGDVAGRLRIWDLKTGATIGKIEYSYPVFAFDIVSLSFGPRLYTGSKDGVVNMWEIDESAHIKRSSVYDGLGGITGITVNTNNQLAVAGRTRSCVLID
ncbi:WD40-repeat-containing domain protein [Lipomyces arxii]|uniref:WD40-repeat-containing domain protein n=1 Tax=Lipomyces arxii TaxID=56418 RepID=UPI0034CD4266